MNSTSSHDVRTEAGKEVAVMRRKAVVALVVLAGLLVPNSAAAGGGVFDFERDYVLVGEWVAAEADFWLPARDRAIIDNDFYAYLVPGGRFIEPPKVPAGAVLLGPVVVVPAENGGLASVGFRVPDVRPGGYTVSFCDRPCRHAFVGDLMGGWLSVVGSRTEARLRARIDRLQEWVDGLYSVLGRRLTGNQERTDGVQARVEQLEEEVARNQAELAVRVAQLERQVRRDGGGFDDAGWIVAAVALVLLAFVSIGRERRHDDPDALADSGVMPDGRDLEWRTEAAEEVAEDASGGSRRELSGVS
jgi:hypothetical protein